MSSILYLYYYPIAMGKKACPAQGHYPGPGASHIRPPATRSTSLAHAQAHRTCAREDPPTTHTRTQLRWGGRAGSVICVRVHHGSTPEAARQERGPEPLSQGSQVSQVSHMQSAIMMVHRTCVRARSSVRRAPSLPPYPPSTNLSPRGNESVDP